MALTSKDGVSNAILEYLVAVSMSNYLYTVWVKGIYKKFMLI